MFMVVRTPLSFKVENEEVIVLVSWEQKMDKANFDIFYRVGKRTVVSILTLSYLTRIAMTELCLILIFVI